LGWTIASRVPGTRPGAVDQGMIGQPIGGVPDCGAQPFGRAGIAFGDVEDDVVEVLKRLRAPDERERYLTSSVIGLCDDR
jgi:hypothetical protein